MANDNVLNSLEESPYSTNPIYESYLDDLKKLRQDGAAKERAIKNENQEIRLNKQLDKETKRTLLEENKEALVSAKAVKAEKKGEVATLVKTAVQDSNAAWKTYYKKVCEEAKVKIADINAKYKENKAAVQEENAKKCETIKKLYEVHDENISEEELKNLKETISTELKAQKISYHSKLLELSNDRKETIAKIKDEKFSAYMEKYGYQCSARFDTHTPLESLEFKARHYVYNFKLKNYLLKNAIYYVILAFFIICVCLQPSLFSMKNFISILGQSSTKLFFSLGVAGLILLGGTDLSIGRLTGVSVSIVCLIMSHKSYSMNGGIATFDFSNSSFIPSLLLAILVSIVICVAFTSIAGFFTAKFKMHPFITTLSTQLISYGLIMVLFSEVPAFNMELAWARNVRGDSNINLIIFALVAIVIVWFIWNKTKFGKYMYAVGGNSEAAAVSGINVFAVTLGIFIMAGVLYGLGGLFEATRVAVGNPSTGSGTELDAIAACVIGGISFSGGVGKVSGAVIGTIIFSGLTYCLTYCGIDVNMQYIFKGIIIMAAVCLDSLKYLKKK